MASLNSFALLLPPNFGSVALTTAASVVLTQWQAVQVLCTPSLPCPFVCLLSLNSSSINGWKQRLNILITCQQETFSRRLSSSIQHTDPMLFFCPFNENVHSYCKYPCSCYIGKYTRWIQGITMEFKLISAPCWRNTYPLEISTWFFIWSVILQGQWLTQICIIVTGRHTEEEIWNQVSQGLSLSLSLSLGHFLPFVPMWWCISHSIECSVTSAN